MAVIEMEEGYICVQSVFWGATSSLRTVSLACAILTRTVSLFWKSLEDEEWAVGSD